MIDLRSSGEITADQFKERMESLQAQKNRFEQMLAGTNKRIDNWIEVAAKYFDFAEKARIAFETGTPESKKHILAALGSNLFLKDKILSIDWVIPFPQIRGMAKEARAISDRLEPQKDLVKLGQIEENYSNSSSMLRG